MRKNIIARFNELNRDFYARVSDDFSATRTFSWQGWNQLLPFLKNASSATPPRILDLGCGNGRFLEFLRVHLGKKFTYLGLDSSKELLEIAKKKYDGVTFEKFDLVENFLENGKIILPNAEKFDLIVLFGLSHHLPSETLRTTLFTNLKNYLNENGLIIVSNWQFAKETERFSKNMVSWRKIIANKVISWQRKVQLLYLYFHLEKNDFLLDWRKGAESGKAFRYCHLLDEVEMQSIAKENGLSVMVKYMADGRSGRLNQYFVLAKKL